jgi:exonuclease SbcC
MSNYVISQLELENFKLYKEKIKIDFKSSKFVVLDGPNGYGKTTIFDAIELLVTGRINRICNIEYKDGNKPVIFANDINTPIVIKGEFIDYKGNSLVIKRVVENPNIEGKLNGLEKRFKAFILQNFNEEHGKEVEQDDIDKLFGLIPDKNIYNLMNYIQQENTLHFLKLNENERLNAINKLFNIEKEIDEAEQIKRVRDRINAVRKDIGGEDGTGGKIKDFDLEIKKLINENSKSDIKYEKLIIWKEIVWDQEKFQVDEDNFNRIIVEIEKIEKLKKYHRDFINYNKNKRYKYYLEPINAHIIEGTLATLKHIDNNDVIKKRYINQINDARIKEYIKDKKFTEIFDEKVLNEIVKSLLKEDSFEKVKSRIDILRSKKENTNELSELIREINDVRLDLNDKFLKALKLDNELNSEACPMCGFDYSIIGKKLLSKVSEKEKYFTKKLDSTSKSIDLIIEEIHTDFFKNIEEQINSRNQILITKEFIQLLEKYQMSKDEIIHFKEFCTSEGIKLDEYICNNYENIDLRQIHENVVKIKDIISKKTLFVSQEYSIENINFQSIYNEYFDEEEENLLNISADQISSKKAYIKNQYIVINNINRVKKENERDNLKSKYNKLNEYYNKLESVFDIYQKSIRKYSNYMISNIEIPFYIFSGKILQDYQGGLGVFIKADNKNEQIRIKFVNDDESKHDLLNKFSSGQLSGLVISFLLALNTVYSNRKLACILIDDPLQAMDDINMASFVELIRNEFNDTQLIVSTHEDDISRYMRYKFKKYGIEPLRLNLKEIYSE